MNIDFFWNQNLLELIDCLFNFEDNNAKRFKARRYQLPIGIIDNYNVIISGKSFYNQAVYPDLDQKLEIRNLTAGQSEDYITGCLLDYNYIKHHYRLIAIDLSTQKELNTDPQAIQKQS